MKTRLSRLTEEEQYDVEALKDKNNSWAQLTKYLPKMDSYCPLPHHNDVIDFQFNIYESVWPEAAALRKSGKLLELGKHIQCPVVAIHGDYDPHPAEGVQKPLAATLKNFHFILIPQCGHKPWIEKMAHEKFYEILKKETDAR